MSGPNAPEPLEISALRQWCSINSDSYLFIPLPFPYTVYGYAYNAVFVIYQVVIVLLLFMPNVNCQAWSDLKHFYKA